MAKICHVKLDYFVHYCNLVVNYGEKVIWNRPLGLEEEIGNSDAT